MKYAVGSGVAGTILSVAPEAASAEPVVEIDSSLDGLYRLCFLGDSYMAGSDSTDGHGCRKTVVDWLYINNESHNIRCVGSQPSTGLSTRGSIPLVHEGHPGWTTTQLLNLVNSGGLRYANGKPNIVFLMAGANDFGAGASPTTVYSRLNSLVDAVLVVQDNLGIVLCENILMSSYVSSTLTNRTRQAQELNEMLPTLVASKAGRVVLAKTSLLDQQDINSGGVHPTNTGYRKMGYILYSALRQWFGSQGKYLVPVRHPWSPAPDPLRLV